MKWMRGLLMVLILIAISGCSGSKGLVRWVSLENALSLQKQVEQPILFYFYSQNCVYCKLMQLNTFSDPDVAKQINSLFIPVKLDIEENRDGEMPSGRKLASAFRIRGVPALVVVDAAHRTLDSRTGFLTVRKTIAFISAFAIPEGRDLLKKGASSE